MSDKPTPAFTESSGRDTMRAVQLPEWGRSDLLRIGEVERPEPSATEVLVKVKAVGINPIDAVTVDGRGYMDFLSTPYIPGWDFAGVVEKVGYGTTRFTVGDEVYGMPWFPRAANTCAEYVTAPARQIAHKPKSLSFAEAAGIPLAGLTAYQMLVDAAHVSAGDNVLVTGAGGGCGHLAVQIAKALGANVTATASTSKVEFVKGLGADRVVDYTAENVDEVVRDMDAVIEYVGVDNCVRMCKTLRKGGTLVSAHFYLTPGLEEEAERCGVHASWYLVEPDYVALERINELVDNGKLRVTVSEEFPFEKAPEALHAMAQQHSTGVTITSKIEDTRHAKGKLVLTL